MLLRILVLPGPHRRLIRAGTPAAVTTTTAGNVTVDTAVRRVRLASKDDRQPARPSFLLGVGWGVILPDPLVSRARLILHIGRGDFGNAPFRIRFQDNGLSSILVL